MRKQISKPTKPEKSILSVKKILIIAIIFVMLTGMMGVMASNERLVSVKIVLSSGYEMNIMTTERKVSKILSDNHIVVLDGETVVPDLESELSDNKTITITKGEVKVQSDESYFSADEILQSYTSIVEKVVTVEEEIPYETITKDVSGDSELKKNTVVQAGSNGLKQVTYRIKYQNGNEIEKTEISSTIVKEPVNKIVEVRTKIVTSRSSGARISGSVAEYQAYAAEKCNAYGWSQSDFNCLVSLWNRESGWNPGAYNSRSGAYGIPQALPGSKMASAGSDYLTNYKTQINWGLSYIKSRYGNPTNAWSHSQRKGWY